MLRLWRQSQTQRMQVSAGAAISIVAHALLIALAVLGTRRPLGLADTSSELANRPYYVPPPNRVRGQTGATEHLEFITLSPEGPGAGAGPASLQAIELTPPPTPLAGNAGLDPVTFPAAPAIPGRDSVLTEVEVDSAARVDPTSAAPAYPIELLKKNIQGVVEAQYIVDTTGHADPASLKVLHATHPAFVEAVRVALPLMIFEPARLHSRKVRQVVQQSFTFQIMRPASADSVPRKP